MPIASKNINAEKIQGNLNITSVSASVFTGSFIGDGAGLYNLPTGSLLTTASFNAYTGSSASQFAGTASFAYSSSDAITASYYAETDPIFTAVSGTFTTTASFGAFTASYYVDSASIVTEFAGLAEADEQTIELDTINNVIRLKETVAAPLSGIRTFEGNVIITGSLGLTGSMQQQGTFYADQIDVSTGGIQQMTGSYLATFSSSGLLTYDTYQNVANELNQYIAFDTGSLLTTASFESFTGSIQPQVDALIAATSSYVQNSVTASMLAPYVLTSQTASMTVLSSSHAETASYAPSYLPLSGGTVTGNVTLNGDVTVNGTASIAYLHVTYESASVIYSSGSNQLGDATNDTQTLIGRTIVSGSLEVTGSANLPSITGSLFGTASYAISASHAESSSYATTSSYALNALSSSYTSFATSASFAATSTNTSDILIYVKNVTGASIPKGKVVRISGATGDNALISTASWESDAMSANTLGILNETIADQAWGYAMTEGKLLGIDTNNFTAGQLLFLGPTGSIIGYQPVPPKHAVRLGQALRIQQNNGSMYVRIDNGYELDELHNVLIVSGSDGDLLVASGSNDNGKKLYINSKQLTGSYAVTGSLTATSFTGSLRGTASYAAVADSVDDLNQAVYISGSLTVVGSATFYGTASFIDITASNLYVSESWISVNVFEPVERFGGLKVYDSGSSTATASFAWDSLHNHFVYQNVSGSSYSGGMFLSGPRNTGSLGDEPTLTFGFVPRSDGGDHLENSQIYSSGSTHIVTGSLQVTAGVTASLAGTASWANNSITASYVSGSIVSPGSNTQVLYNNAGTVAGASNFVFSGSRVGIGTSTPTGSVQLDVSGSARFTTAITVGQLGINGQINMVRASTGEAVGGMRTISSAVEVGGTSAFYDKITFGNGYGLIFSTFNGSSSSERMRITGGAGNNGNILIGTTSETGHRFVVSGSSNSGSVNLDNTLYVSGSRVGIGFSTPTVPLDVSGSARIISNLGGSGTSFSVFYGSIGNERFRVQENGIARFSNWYTFDNNTGLGILGATSVTDAISITALNIYNTANVTRNLLRVANNITLSSGTTTDIRMLTIDPTINITGGTSTIRGLYYNPTLTSVTGVTHRAIETVTGDVVFGSTSGNVSIGKTGSNARLDVSGSVIITGSLTVTSGITGSLFGTASWAQNAVTASYVQTAQTASYVLNAVSASYASFAVTASYIDGGFY